MCARLHGLDEVKRAIVEQGPVLLAVVVTQSFVDAKKHIPEPYGIILGGHAIVACGYDDNITLGSYTGGVLTMNSWGESWAEGGFCWLPYAAWSEPWWIDRDLDWPFVLEMWACVDLPYTPRLAKQIVLQIGNPTALVDGQRVQVDIPPKVISGRTLIPVRFVAERMGYVVNWQAKNRLVELRRP